MLPNRVFIAIGTLILTLPLPTYFLSNRHFVPYIRIGTYKIIQFIEIYAIWLITAKIMCPYAIGTRQNLSWQ